MAERKRERIEPNEGDVRFVRRNEKGQFDEVVDAGRSLSQDRKQHSETEVESGHGDRGDHSNS